MFIFISLIVLFSFLQATFLGLDVVTGLVLWMLLVWPERKAWAMTLLAGLVVDVVAGRELGWNAMIYLFIGLLLYFYRRRYAAWHPVFMGLFVSGSVLLVNFITMGRWVWIQATVVGLVGLLLRKWMMERQKGGGQLRLEYKS
jgi:hypothetical protein